MTWLNRVICWITGYHIFKNYSPIENFPKCTFCERSIFDGRCTGWPRKKWILE